MKYRTGNRGFQTPLIPLPRLLFIIQVAEAFKCLDMCNEAIAKKAFNRANECFKRASDLFKHTNGDTLEATRKTLNQVAAVCNMSSCWCCRGIS